MPDLPPAEAEQPNQGDQPNQVPAEEQQQNQVPIQSVDAPMEEQIQPLDTPAEDPNQPNQPNQPQNIIQHPMANPQQLNWSYLQVKWMKMWRHIYSELMIGWTCTIFQMTRR